MQRLIYVALSAGTGQKNASLALCLDTGHWVSKEDREGQHGCYIIRLR